MPRDSVQMMAIATSLLCCLLAPLPLARGQSGSPGAKIVRLLEESGYSYTKAADNVWTVPFKGKVLVDFHAVVTTQEDIVVLFVILADKDEVEVTPEVMRKLLKLNHNLDRVKIGITENGDVFVRTDLSVRVLDLQEMKLNLEQVAAAADEVVTAIHASLKRRQ